MRYVITINYIGTGFVGWQSQVGGGSIQDCVEAALQKLTGEKTTVFASGRTDAGVHALAQVAHFDLKKPFDCHKITAGLNFYLPHTVRISSAELAPDGFHARKTAKQKTYIYVMYKSSVDNAFLLDRALRIPTDADIDSMNRAAAHFVGTHDFYAFMSAGSSVKTTTRTIFSSQVITTSLSSILSLGEDKQSNDSCFDMPLVIYKVTADGFLYNMVRKIAAYILKAATGKLDPDEIPNLIQSKDRTKTKEVARPEALYLHSVKYQ